MGRSCYVWDELRQLVHQTHERPEVSQVRESREVPDGSDSVFTCRDARIGEIVATESSPRVGDCELILVVGDSVLEASDGKIYRIEHEEEGGDVYYVVMLLGVQSFIHWFNVCIGFAPFEFILSRMFFFQSSV